MSLIELHAVSKTFAPTSRGAAPLVALSDINLSVEAGSIFGIIGYSGAGKSTLVRLINALESATDGSVRVNDQELSSLSERELRGVRSTIGMIFQQFNLFRSKTVFENIAYPLRIAGERNEAIRIRVHELLEFVGLTDKAKAYPEQLSGGQKQRVGIARALATKPTILLADEATSALDPETTREVLDLLRRANEEYGVTIVLITHEMELIKQLATHVAVMDAGHIIETGTALEVFSNPQAEITQRFVSTVLHSHPSAEEATALAQQHSARIVTIGFQRSSDNEAQLIARLVTAGIAVELVQGGVGDIQGHSVGTLTFALRGDDATIDGVLSHFGELITVHEGGARA